MLIFWQEAIIRG